MDMEELMGWDLGRIFRHIMDMMTIIMNTTVTTVDNTIAIATTTNIMDTMGRQTTIIFLRW